MIGLQDRAPVLVLQATIRCAALVAALVAFFVIGAPLQWFWVTRLRRDGSWLPALFGRTLMRLCRVTVSVRGILPERESALVLANHISWIDVLALATVRPFCFLAKHEIAAWPIVSTFAAVQGTVFVERSRRRSIPRANGDMAARLAAGRSVLLFPEGTTLAGPLPGPFKTSHTAAARDRLACGPTVDHVAVQPVAIAYSGPHAAWIGDETLAAHLWRVLTSAPLHCTLHIGAPIRFTQGTDRKVITRACRDRILALLEQTEGAEATASPPASYAALNERGRDAA